MLFSPVSNYGWSVDNFGATYTDSGIGTQIPSHASNHTKGTATSLIAGASITEDVYGIAIGFTGGWGSGGIRMWMTDLLIDPAGGTSWSVAIANLAANSPHICLKGCWYYFPLYLKNGTSIGMQTQCNAGSNNIRGLVRVFGKPTHPELVKAGTKVETFGATTASTTGVSITPGTSAMGALTASMGTTAGDLWWWQAGNLMSDSARAPHALWMDVLAGDGTNNVLCASRSATGRTTPTRRAARTLSAPASPTATSPRGPMFTCAPQPIRRPRATSPLWPMAWEGEQWR